MAKKDKFKTNLLKPNHVVTKKRDAYRPATRAKKPVAVPRPPVIYAPEHLKVDVIICVHNALSDVKRCLNSILEANLSVVKHIILVNDGSDAETTAFLKKWKEKNNQNTVLIDTHKSPRGYTNAANTGLSFSFADVGVLLNSDTIVCKDTFKKLLEPFYLDKKIGIVGPLSNAAGPQSIPSTKRSKSNTAINALPTGMTIEQVDKYCEAWSLPAQGSVGRSFPIVPLIHGFCLAIKKETRHKIGYFDEKLFPNGYGEENDYCMRAQKAGVKCAVATNTFIYHAKSKSYTNASVRHKLMKKALDVLHNKYSYKWVDAHTQTRNHPELVRIRKEAQNLWNKKDGKKAPKIDKTRIRSKQKILKPVVKKRRR